MKRLILCLLASLSISVYAQTVMPSSTRAALIDIQKHLASNRGKPDTYLLRLYPIYKIQGEYRLAVMCKTKSSFTRQSAQENGIVPGGMVADIASLKWPLAKLSLLYTWSDISYAEVAEKTDPFLNQAVGDIRADSVHMGINLPSAFTGKNVLIGICDWGFDYTHPMFYDTSLTQTRILAAWDQQKVIGTPPPGFSHGAVYTTPAQLMAAQSDTFSHVSDTHGTHVAGIAGGSGGGTIYRGIGFESQFLFSQMWSDVSSSLDAFAWMYDNAQQQGKRLVINNSWGGYRSNPLDGSSLISQAADAYADSNVVIIFSAGNNGGVNFHLKKTFNNDSVKTRVSGFNYSLDPDLWGEAITMWGEAGNDFSAQIRILDASNQLLVQTPLFTTATSPIADTFLITGPDTIWYKVTGDAAHPLNGKPTLDFRVKNTNGFLRVILYSEAAAGTVHYYNTRYTIYGGGNTGYAFTALTTGYVNGDKSYGVGHPGVTSSVITTAAHMSNSAIASFSSYGPRIDEMLKPEISAPGNLVTSSLSSFAAGSYTVVASTTFNSNNYDFVRFSGTSMSAPMVTGGAALMLQAFPYLSPAQVKNLITSTARADNFTGPIPPAGSTRWGWGKLDVYQAIKQNFVTGVEETRGTENAILVYPNPTTGKVYISGVLDGTERYTVMSLDGKIIQQNKLMKREIDLGNFSAGMYVLVIENAQGITNWRISVCCQ